MPPTVQPPHVRALEVLSSGTRNSLTNLTSRQGLESGTPGPPGEPGEPGAPGEPAKSYVFTEGAPSASWTILHKLKRFPSVFVQDTAGNTVEGVITYTNEEELTVDFSAAFSGKAFLN
jgi:hypothetical protein